MEQQCPYQEVDDQDYGAHHFLLKNNRGQLVQTTIDHTKRLYPDKKIQIQAQAYLEKFYESFGFKPVSAVYLEDGIPHLDMVME